MWLILGYTLILSQGKPYCDAHFAKLFCDNCVHCNEPIVGNALTVFQKSWHPHCFKCFGCKRNLGQEFVPWDGKPMCSHCYKKLPSKVKKANKKKVLAERKMDEREDNRQKKEEKLAAKSKGKEVNKEELWKKRANEVAKQRRAEKANEYKSTKNK
tara:strand:- start:1769 stop:2236 length:468 start_codon:yes stop_codon:yes gene_type:complete